VAREHTSTHSLAGILTSAVEFGLSPDAVWETVVAAPDRLPTDLRALYIDELAGELARRLLEQQSRPRDPRPAAHQPPPPRSLRRQLVVSSAVTLLLIVVVILAQFG
jgi:hypothetical protein